MRRSRPTPTRIHGIGGRCILTTLVVAVFGTGCSGADAGSLVTIRDSAGVEIVEHVPGALAGVPEWALGDGPVVRVGVLDGAEEYQFHNLLDARRLGDGRMAALDFGSRQVRVYDAGGGFLWAQGREGKGPGEYALPFGLLLLDRDRLAVFDPSTSRITVLDGDGAVAGVAPLPRRFANPSRPAGLLPDGRLVLEDRQFDIDQTGMRTQHMNVWALAADGASADSLLHLPWGLLGPVDGGRMVGGPLFGHRGQLAVAGDRVVFGPADAYEIREHAPDGALRRIVRWQGPDRSVSEDDAAAYIDRVLAGFPPEEEPAQRRHLEALPVPAERPAYDLLAGDDAGRVWVREWAPPGMDEGRRWWVFGRSGRLVATVATPHGFTPLDFGEDYLLGRHQDALEVEYLALYELDRDDGR